MVKNELINEESKQLSTLQQKMMQKVADNKYVNNVKASDLAIPYLNLLQPLSPQLDEESSSHIPGAKPGMMLNTALNKLYPKEGLDIIPLFYCKEYVEWVSREDGGGFVDRHGADILLKANKREDGRLEYNSHDIVETAYFFVYSLEDKQWLLMPMTSTKLKEARKLNTLIQAQKIGDTVMPLFYNIYHLKSVQQENKKGKFYNYQVSLVKTIDDESLFDTVEKLHLEIINEYSNILVKFNQAENKEQADY